MPGPLLLSPPAAGRSPHRRCLVTGDVRTKAELLRFVVAPDGLLVADVAGRLPGRGLWLTARRDILARAVQLQLFQRAARRSVRVPGDLLDTVEAQVLRHCLELVGLLRRAGQAVFGFDKAADWLRSGKAALLVAARDGDPRDKARLRACAAADWPVITVLTAAELGSAVGRERIVHGAIAAGPLGAALLRESRRLAGVRGSDGEAPVAGDAVAQQPHDLETTWGT